MPIFNTQQQTAAHICTFVICITFILKGAPPTYLYTHVLGIIVTNICSNYRTARATHAFSLTNT